MLTTKEKLKFVLNQWKEFKIPELVKRDFDMRYIASDNILAIAGPRRAGKTFLCFQLIKELMKSMPPENILYVNFEDERLYPMTEDALTLLLDVYYELFDIKQGMKYIFIDEIQNVPNWGRWCRRIQESRKDIKLIITGSSSKLLSREIATELRGRTLTRIVLPYSFREFLRAKSVNYTPKHMLYKSEKSIVKKNFNEYVQHGGFPQIASSELKEQILKEYFSTIFYKDIVDRFTVKNTQLLEDFLKLVVDSFASAMSLSKMENKLKSLGHKVSKATLKTYFLHARDVFLFFDAKKYSYKRTEQIRNPSKVYAIDTGIINSVRFSFSEDYGRYLENIVFLEIIRREYEVYYFKGDRECDFLVKEGDKIKQAIQVTKTINGENRAREIEGLVEAMKSYHLKTGLILTDDDYEEIKIDTMKITVKPIWLWLLS